MNDIRNTLGLTVLTILIGATSSPNAHAASLDRGEEAALTFVQRHVKDASHKFEATPTDLCLQELAVEGDSEDPREGGKWNGRYVKAKLQLTKSRQAVHPQEGVVQAYLHPDKLKVILRTYYSRHGVTSDCQFNPRERSPIRNAK